jgi:hypothetical protein
VVADVQKSDAEPTTHDVEAALHSGYDLGYVYALLRRRSTTKSRPTRKVP